MSDPISEITIEVHPNGMRTEHGRIHPFKQQYAPTGNRPWFPRPDGRTCESFTFKKGKEAGG